MSKEWDIYFSIIGPYFHNTILKSVRTLVTAILNANADVNANSNDFVSVPPSTLDPVDGVSVKKNEL